MQRVFTLVAAFIAAAPALAAAGPAGGGGARQRIAVLDVRAVQGVAPGTATVLTAIVVGDVAAAGFDVISQSDVAALLGFEKQRQLVGCAEDSSCLGEIGGALGVDLVVTGQVGQIGSRFHLALQLLDVRKARVISRAARFSGRNEDELADAAQRSIADLLRDQRASSPAPPRAPAAARPPLLPPPDLSARPRIPPPVAPADPAVGPSRTPAWLALGAGVGLVAGGALLGAKARRDRSELTSAWARPDYAALYDAKMSSARSAARLANACFAAGAISAGVSGWLFWRSRTPAVAVAPATAGDGGLALAAAGSF